MKIIAINGSPRKDGNSVKEVSSMVPVLSATDCMSLSLLYSMLMLLLSQLLYTSVQSTPIPSPSLNVSYSV